MYLEAYSKNQFKRKNRLRFWWCRIFHVLEDFRNVFFVFLYRCIRNYSCGCRNNVFGSAFMGFFLRCFCWNYQRPYQKSLRKIPPLFTVVCHSFCGNGCHYFLCSWFWSNSQACVCICYLLVDDDCVFIDQCSLCIFVGSHFFRSKRKKLTFILPYVVCFHR